MKPIRQGDVLLVPVTQYPEVAKKRRPGKRGHVLMEGEVTGHAHTIEAQEGVSLVTAKQAEELRMWLLVETEEPVALVHEEHSTLTIPPGAYEVIRQVEYTPEALRAVSD